MAGWSEQLEVFLVSFPAFLIAVIFHEYAHGRMALYFGDSTARQVGRLTLNPLPHIDWVGTILLPMVIMLSGIQFLWGWARPVPIDPRQFDRPRLGLFWVSFAGPLMNFCLAVLSAAGVAFLVKFVSSEFYFFEALIKMLQASIVLNFALGLFNLVPLPPLDGSRMIQSVLSPSVALRYESLARASGILLLLLMLSGLLRYMAIPIQWLTEWTLTGMAWVFGL